MTSSIKASGSCLCGAVKVSATTKSFSAGVCHCDTCRKWGGGPAMTVECLPDIDFSGEENISVFDSSEWAERGFCNSCGTHIFYRLKQNQQYYMPTGLFDIEAELIFDHQVFIEQKPEYYAFANKTKDMTGEELFALASGDSPSPEN